MGLEVATLATLALVTSAAGTGLAAYGQYQQGQAQASSAKYQAAVAANNAALSEINAGNARRDAALVEAQAAQEQTIAIRRGRAAVGAAVASTASRGVLVDEGSAMDIRSGVASLANEDAQNIAQAGARRGAAGRIQAFNYEQQAAAGVAQSDMYRSQAASAETGALLSASSTLLRGAGSIYGQYSDMARSGVAFNNKTLVS